MGITVGNLSTLMINNVTASNGGEYTCVVINAAGIGLSASQLYVEPYFIEEPTNVEINYADRLELSCIAEAFPEHTLQWQVFNNDQNGFVDISQENETVLIYENGLLNHTGEYRCVAINYINGSMVTTHSSTAMVKGKKN